MFIIGQNLFSNTFNMVDYLLKSKSVTINKQNIKKKKPHYKPESFDTTVVRPRTKFEKIDNDMPYFKNTNKGEM